jgi:hypothetical protein
MSLLLLSSADSVAPTPPTPTPSFLTIPASIRDRAIAVIAGLVPNTLLGVPFVKHRNERDGDFVKWATANPAAALRRFQVRQSGDEGPPVTNTDTEERRLKLTITVAYPQTARFGRDNALDRDDVITEDYKQLDFAIGLYGKQNFSDPYPSATPFGFTPQDVVAGEGVDFLVIEEWFVYQRLTS